MNPRALDKAEAAPFFENDALSVEYELMYGCARRELHIADIVDDPAAFGEGGVLGSGFEEEFANAFLVELGPRADD